MVQKLKPAILFTLHLLFLQSVCGQIPVNITDYISQRFVNYCAAVPREEIFIHFDRAEYIAGENVWFKLYLIDRQTFRPSLNSRIAYFELLNSENRPVVQKRIFIENGFGPGQIVLPDTLSSGKYTIRAYTRWMRNFLPLNCFMKEINIYNGLSEKPFTDKLSSASHFDTTNDSGVNTDKVNTGLTLKVNNLRTDTLEIFIDTDSRYNSENKNLIYLFIQTHGLINRVSAEKTVPGISRIGIPKNVLIPGINHITIFNSYGQPISDRLIFTPAKDQSFITLHSIDSCDTRTKLSLDIAIDTEFPNRSDSTNLSISVAPLTDEMDHTDMKDYLVFGTEYGLLSSSILKGRKISELPQEAADSILFHVKSNWIDWTNILSGDIPDFKYPAEKEDHILSGKLITNDQKSAHSIESILLCTPGKDAGFQHTKTDSDGNFNFHIHIDEGLNDLVIMPANPAGNHKIIIGSSFSDRYLPYEKNIDSVSKQIPAYISDWSANYQVSKIFEVSSLWSALLPAVQPLKPTRFYGKPDIELILANYISLPVMEEVFYELLPHVSLKKRNSTYEISISDRIDDHPYISSPTILLDGVIIKDASLISDLAPEIVEKIDVIKGKYLVGNYLFTGLVNVITKSGDFSCVALPDYMIRLPYRVLDGLRSFKYPDYSSAEVKNSRIPDFRNTLYWNPSVKPGKDGKTRVEFWSSDVVSDYEINIQGISSQGKFISERKLVRVKQIH